jgi:NAD-dependent deacetylase
MQQHEKTPAPEIVAMLRQMIRDAKRIVAFTGAGISTSAGIPDYRSPGGVWSKIQPITLQEFVRSEAARLEDWRRRFEMNEQFARAEPTIAHRVLADMLRDDRQHSIITQNIDGLHQRSGVAEDQLIELHGNATYGHCIDCRLRVELAIIRDMVAADHKCPVCSACGGLIKAAVVSFGEAMPQDRLADAIERCSQAELILVAGSSLVVQPAANLPHLAVQKGAKLVIINKQSTPLDHIAELVLNHSVDLIFSAIQRPGNQSKLC